MGVIKRLKWLSILYGVALAITLPLTNWVALNYEKSLQ